LERKTINVIAMYVKEKSLDGTKWIINIVNVYHSNSIFGTKIEFIFVPDE